MKTGGRMTNNKITAKNFTNTMCSGLTKFTLASPNGWIVTLLKRFVKFKCSTLDGYTANNNDTVNFAKDSKKKVEKASITVLFEFHLTLTRFRKTRFNSFQTQTTALKLSECNDIHVQVKPIKT